MSIFTQEYARATVDTAQAPGTNPFVPLHFRQRGFTEFGDGEYRISLSDGTSFLAKARSALEAMELGLQQGSVRKVERASLNRLKLLSADVVNDRLDDPLAAPLIKPGAILVSFATMRQLVQPQSTIADAAEAFQSVTSTTITVSDEPAASVIVAEQETLPPSEASASEAAVLGMASMEAHDFTDEQLAAIGLVPPLDRALTAGEIEQLLLHRNG